MEKQITELRAGAESRAKSRGEECNEEGSRLDLAQKDLPKAYKQQYDAETSLEAMRTRTELRSTQLSGQLSEVSDCGQPPCALVTFPPLSGLSDLSCSSLR